MIHQVFFLSSERTLDLELKLENNEKYGYFWTGEIAIQLSKFEINEIKTVTIHLVPFKSGLLVNRKILIK